MMAASILEKIWFHRQGLSFNWKQLALTILKYVTAILLSQDAHQ